MFFFEAVALQLRANPGGLFITHSLTQCCLPIICTLLMSNSVQFIKRYVNDRSGAAAKVLCCCVRGRGFDQRCGSCFSDGGEERNRPCPEISSHVEDTLVVKYNPESSNTARL